MAKVLCVLYDDPVDGYSKSYPRPGIPTLEQYPNGQSMPTPRDPAASASPEPLILPR